MTKEERARVQENTRVALANIEEWIPYDYITRDDYEWETLGLHSGRYIDMKVEENDGCTSYILIYDKTPYKTWKSVLKNAEVLGYKVEVRPIEHYVCEEYTEEENCKTFFTNEKVLVKSA